MISVVVPCVDGREPLLEQTRQAYAQHSTGHELEWIVVKNRPDAGTAWNEGAALATGDYLHLTCDDMAPHPGWADVATLAADDGVFPSPRLLNLDGSLHSCGTLGGGLTLPECRDGFPALASPLPFVRREWWTPDACLAVHYYADDWLGFLARASGLRVEVRRGYLFTHLEGTVGRQRMVDRAMTDRQTFLDAAVAR